MNKALKCGGNACITIITRILAARISQAAGFELDPMYPVIKVLDWLRIIRLQKNLISSRSEKRMGSLPIHSAH